MTRRERSLKASYWRGYWHGFFTIGAVLVAVAIIKLIIGD